MNCIVPYYTELWTLETLLIIRNKMRLNGNAEVHKII